MARPVRRNKGIVAAHACGTDKGEQAHADKKKDSLRGCRVSPEKS